MSQAVPPSPAMIRKSSCRPISAGIASRRSSAKVGATAFTKTLAAGWAAISIAIVIELEQRERAQDMRRCGRRGGVQIRPVELGKTLDPEQAETALRLILQQFEQAHDAGLPGRRERKALHAADADQIGAGGDRLDDVAAA